MGADPSATAAAARRPRPPSNNGCVWLRDRGGRSTTALALLIASHPGHACPILAVTSASRNTTIGQRPSPISPRPTKREAAHPDFRCKRPWLFTETTPGAFSTCLLYTSD